MACVSLLLQTVTPEWQNRRLKALTEKRQNQNPILLLWGGTIGRKRQTRKDLP
jgi:hypothetical protein